MRHRHLQFAMVESILLDSRRILPVCAYVENALRYSKSLLRCTCGLGKVLRKSSNLT